MGRPFRDGMRRGNNKQTGFPDTQWSLVGRAASRDEPVRQQALANILDIYSPVLRSFLSKSCGLSTDRAEDLVQDFIADRILHGQILGQVDRARGKLRNFLAKSLWNFARTRLAKEQRHAACGNAVDLDAIDDPAAARAFDQFDQAWVRQVVQATLTRMQADCAANGRDDIWEVFRQRISDPVLHDVEQISYDDIARQLDIGSPRQAINILATAKRSFLRHLRTVVGEYVQGDEQVKAELNDLKTIVAG